MIHADQIKPDMPVVCSQDGQFAIVDHMEGRNEMSSRTLIFRFMLSIARGPAPCLYRPPLEFIRLICLQDKICR